MQIRSARHFDCAIFSVTSRVDLYRPEMSVLPSRRFENSGKYIHLSSYSNVGKRCVVQFCGNSNKTVHAYVTKKLKFEAAVD